MNRRSFLTAASAAPIAVGLTGCAAPGGSVTVTGLEIFKVPVNHRGDWILVRLQTSAGITGIGDASHGRPDERTIELLRQFFGALEGRSIYEVERFRQQVEPAAVKARISGAVAMSALEQALYDIMGKVHNVPSYVFFGGKLRDHLRNYANINRMTTDRTPSGFASSAESAVEAGFDAVKLAPWDGMPKGLTDKAEIERHMRPGIDCIAAIRKAIGPKVDLLIDGHSHFNQESGIELARRLEEYNLFWLEEVSPGIEALAAIDRAAKMPTAGGESIYGVEDFYRYISGNAVDIAMPDVKYCGGMLLLKKISAIAEGAGLQVSPHGPASPVGNVTAGHVCVTMPNFLILEFAHGEVPWRAELIEPAEHLEPGGILTISDRPGLGITLNDRMVSKHLVA